MPFDLFSSRSKPKPQTFILCTMSCHLPKDLRAQIFYILEPAFGRRYVEHSEWHEATLPYHGRRRARPHRPIGYSDRQIPLGLLRESAREISVSTWGRARKAWTVGSKTQL